MENVNKQQVEVIRQSVCVPSFFNWFEEGKVDLFFSKNPICYSNDGLANNSVEIENIAESFEELDLTGKPLEIDLFQDDTIGIVEDAKTISKWRREELRYFPLPLEQARQELNKLTKNNSKSPIETSIYAVCNGQDGSRTVIIGADIKTFTSCSVKILGTIMQSDLKKRVEEIVKSELNPFQQPVKCVTKMSYNLYGTSLVHVANQVKSMRGLPFNGHIKLDISTPRKAFDISEIKEGNAKMHLEVIVGNNFSRLNMFWKDLLFLNKLIDILSVRVQGDTGLCEDSLDFHIILEKLSVLMSTQFVTIEPQRMDFRLDELRQLDFLDNLWVVLKRCKDVSVLRDSFIFLFNELSSNITLKIQDSHSKIASVLKNITKSNVSLLNVTYEECIDFLIEMGLQKLKSDFQEILKQYLPQSARQINSVWEAIYSAKYSNPGRSRFTRVTDIRNVKDISLKQEQFAYLCQLFIASEFTYLFSNIQMNTRTTAFDHFWRSLESGYITSHCNIKFSDIYLNPLKQLSFDMELKSTNTIRTNPSRWTLSVQQPKVNIVLDLSNSPIFPPSIYDYGVSNSDIKNEVYFASIMVRVKVF